MSDEKLPKHLSKFFFFHVKLWQYAARNGTGHSASCDTVAWGGVAVPMSLMFSFLGLYALCIYRRGVYTSTTQVLISTRCIHKHNTSPYIDEVYTQAQHKSLSQSLRNHDSLHRATKYI